jgi:hypothetical protein
MAKQSNGLLTRLHKLTYLGSHPERTGQLEHVTLSFFKAGVQADGKRRNTMFARGWDELIDLRAEDRESLERKVTGTRFLLMGAWSLAFQKKTVVSYVSVTDASGDWVFAVPELSVM